VPSLCGTVLEPTHLPNTTGKPSLFLAVSLLKELQILIEINKEIWRKLFNEKLVSIYKF